MILSANRQPLRSYNYHALHSARAAAEHCERVFSSYVDFSFDDEDDRTYLTSGAVHTDHFRLSTTTSSGHRICLNETALCTVLVPLRGSVSITTDGFEHVAGAGQGIIALPGKRTTATSRDFLGIVGLIPDIKLELNSAVSRPSSQLIGFLRYLVDAFDTSPQLVADTRAHAAMGELIGQLVHQSTNELWTSSGKGLSTNEHHVRRAEDWIAEHAGELCSVADLARAISVTPRTLQAAFRQHRNCTPRQMIERHRLERIHQKLSHAGPDETVTSIAMDNGVVHLGRFAASYRSRFGESPSDTLARSRSR